LFWATLNIGQPFARCGVYGYIMQKCGYCGKENKETSSHCSGCGLSLSEDWPSFSIPRPIFVLLGLLFCVLINFFIEDTIVPEIRRHLPLTDWKLTFELGLLPANFLTILVGIPCVVWAFRHGLQIIGWMGVFLVLLPIPLGLILLALQAHFNGFSSD
jgi:hypothetical protein